MLVFSNDAGPTHDLFVLIEPTAPWTERGSDLIAEWISQVAEAVYPTAAHGLAPHVVACAEHNTRYAIVIHQCGCNVNAWIEHSEYTRSQLVVAEEASAPTALFLASHFATALQTAHPPIGVTAVGVSAITAAFAQEMWTKLVTHATTWRSEPVWLSTPRACTVTADATDPFGRLRSPAKISESPDGPFSTI